MIFALENYHKLPSNIYDTVLILRYTICVSHYDQVLYIDIYTTYCMGSSPIVILICYSLIDLTCHISYLVFVCGKSGYMGLISTLKGLDRS